MAISWLLAIVVAAAPTDQQVRELFAAARTGDLQTVRHLVEGWSPGERRAHLGHDGPDRRRRARTPRRRAIPAGARCRSERPLHVPRLSSDRGGALERARRRGDPAASKRGRESRGGARSGAAHGFGSTRRGGDRERTLAGLSSRGAAPAGNREGCCSPSGDDPRREPDRTPLRPR